MVKVGTHEETSRKLHTVYMKGLVPPISVWLVTGWDKSCLVFTKKGLVAGTVWFDFLLVDFYLILMGQVYGRGRSRDFRLANVWFEILEIFHVKLKGFFHQSKSFVFISKLAIPVVDKNGGNSHYF